MKQWEYIRNRGFCAGFFHRSFVRSAAWVLLGAVLSLTGCSKDLAEGPAVGDSEIAVSASLPASLEAEFSTKAPVDGSAQMTLYFARSDESSTGVWGGYGTTALTATRAGGQGSRTLTFTAKQYYQRSGLKTRMMGWYPSATYTNGVVSWTINGTQDILCAPAQEGSKTAAMPAFTFSHKLTQLQFYCYAENQSAVDQWGKITAIRVLGQRTACSYTLSTGVFAFSGSTASLSVPGITAAAPPVGEAIAATQYGQALMIEPKTAASQLFVEIDTERGGTLQLALPVQAYEAGKSAKVMVYFRMVGCNVGCILQREWLQSDVTNGDVGNPQTAYPYVLKDNIFVTKDVYGCADPDTYPTHEAWTTTPAHTESAATANASGYNTVGERFQAAKANAVGKDGSSETMTWYEASGTVNATYNAAGYSACAQYSELSDQSDKGTWRLPTVRELKLIYDNGRSLTDPVPFRGYYWSATEENTAAVKVVNYQTGAMTNSAKQMVTNYRVCCVRDTEIVPIRSDYPKIVNGNIIVVEDLAGRADPAEYPVHNKWTVTPPHAKNESTAALDCFGRTYQIAKANAVGKDRSSETMTWYEATGTSHEIYNSSGYSACAQYSEATGQSDKGLWRVPTAQEMHLCLTIVKRGEVKGQVFPYLPSSGKYWTTTEKTGSGYGVGAFYTYFEGGGTISDSKSNTYYLRCVRDL